MNDNERQRKMKAIAEEAVRLETAFGTPGPDGRNVMQRVRQAEPGIKAQAYDAPSISHSGGVVSDPTGQAIAGRPENAPSVAATTEREIDVRVSRVWNDLNWLAKVTDANGPLRLANEADRLALARQNTVPDPGCQSCARIDSPHVPGEPWFVDADPDNPKASLWPDRRGTTRLDDPMVLCEWCRKFLQGYWRLPTKKELVVHQQGRRPMLGVNEEKDIARRKQERMSVKDTSVGGLGATIDAPEREAS